MIRYKDGKVDRGTVNQDGDTGEWVYYRCSSCEEIYSLRPNMEPTPFCDSCAHLRCIELADALDTANAARIAAEARERKLSELWVEWLDGIYDVQDLLRRVRIAVHRDGPRTALKDAP